MKSILDIDLGVDIYKDNEFQETINCEDADYDRCPMCESYEIEFGDCDPENVFIYRIHKCKTCNTEWEERYDLVQVRITIGNLEIIEDK